MSNISVNDDFSMFCSNLQISKPTNDTILKRLQTITKRINNDFWHIDSENEHSLFVGSYGRGTAIYTSDVDVVVELPWNEYSRFNDYTHNGQSAFLQSVKHSILKTYPTSNVQGDGQVVKIDFSDGIKFEIVPAFKFNDGTFYYADSNDGGKWKSMNPSIELLMFDYYDGQFNGNLKRLGKMVRAWKTKMTVLMPGILIDTISYHFLSQYQYAASSFVYYDWISRDFFKYLMDNKDKHSWSKFGSGELVDVKYSDSIFSDSKKAYDISLEAIAANNNKLYYTWHNKWRDIYGTKFPNT